MNWKIPLADLDFGPEESAAVQDVLNSRWLTMGEITQEFELAFAQYNQVKHAIAVANGTAALHLACAALGLGRGDEVITPALTFVATANAIRYTGGTPTFADIVSPTDLTISPEAIESQINDRTKAIMVMHYAGYACDMTSIAELAQKYHLSVIEDAAHAIGSDLEGRKLGCWGNIGCFSFFSNKNMTTGEGGMLVTNDDELAAKVRLMRSHGMTTLTWDRHRGHAWGYDVVELGYNYRMDEIHAALGLVQLGKLEKNNERRRLLTRLYHALFATLLPFVTLPFSEHRGKSAAHILPILIPDVVDRISIMEQLKQQGIQSSHHYPPVHCFSAYQQLNAEKNPHLPITENVADREITLPLYPTMEDDNVHTVVKAVQEALGAA
jgi:dTDP-4-amino-4,6-dideoxygalactose transaminase